MKKSFYIIFILLLLSSCIYDNGYRDVDEMQFSDLDSVQQAIGEMDILISFLPEAETPSRQRYYVVRPNKDVEINNIVVNTIEKIKLSDLQHQDLFKKFSAKGEERFLFNLKFLYKNNITGAVPDFANWQHTFYYKCFSGDDVGMIRKIKYIYKSSDSLNPAFNHEFRILNKQGKLILYKIAENERTLTPCPDFESEAYPSQYIDSIGFENKWILESQ